MKKKTLAKRLRREHVINKAQGRVIHRMTLQISQLTAIVDELQAKQCRLALDLAKANGEDLRTLTGSAGNSSSITFTKYERGLGGTWT